MSLLGATILTAIATVVLAIGAVITALLAGGALKKQSEEVRILQKQAKDATDLLEVQSDQLDVQRDQFESLRKISEKQAEVLGLQARDLRESLKERERLRKATERVQADEISFRMTATKFPSITEEDGGDNFAVPPGETVHMATVSNGSRRPIKNVQCSLGDARAADPFPKTHSDIAVIAGRIVNAETLGSGEPHLVDLVPRSRVLRILPGEVYGFVFELNSHYDLALSHVTASFTDDADLRWQLDRTQHLEPLPDSE